MPVIESASSPVQTPFATAAVPIVNVSGYRFVPLELLPLLQADLSADLARTGVRGTVLLAEEGINVALAGPREAIEAARAVLQADPRFAGLWLKESLSDALPFAKLKVRVRREIITFEGGSALGAPRPVAPRVAPAELRRWLDGGRELTLLDTRNDYEIDAGGFDDAVTLDIGHFRDFTAGVERALAAGRLDPERPLVTFCTGGIRCEKAVPWLLERGFNEVHQIEGGVLGWFESEGDAHWHGNCFVFDDRVSLTPARSVSGHVLCSGCHRAIVPGERCERCCDIG